MTTSSVDAAHQIRSAADATSSRSGLDGWQQVERALAVLGVILVASRVNVYHVLTLGDLFCLAMAPLWLSALRRYVGATLLFVVGVLVLPVGYLLTWIASFDHATRSGTATAGATLMIGMLASAGFLLWAREKISIAAIVSLFGIGLLIGISSSGGLYAANPWRFGYSVPITVLALGLALYSHRRIVELVVALILTAVSGLSDARSSFAILLMTTALVLWQMRPRAQNRRGSAVRALLGLGALAVVAYNVGVALILAGFLGQQTQQRSLRQIDEAGSLILGGRPEIAATIALIKERWYGLGIGTLPNHQDVVAVKTAMSRLNYDPNNGYVDNHMLGDGFALHSMVGDLWAQAGIVGMAFVLIILVLTLRSMGRLLAANAASAIFLYLAVKTLWNVFFSPWYSSIPVLVLLLAVGLERQTVRGSGAKARLSPALDGQGSLV